MNLKFLPAALGGACAVLLLQSLTSSRSLAQGALDPPGGPAPSMLTLAELGAKVDALQARLDTRLPGGKNVAVALSNGFVAAWDHETGTWTDFNLGGTIGPLTESNGNFLFINNFGAAAAWSSETKAWSGVNFPGQAISHSDASNGNFFLGTNGGRVAAWNKTTQAWDGFAMGGVINGSAGSEGNYIFTSSTGVGAVWNQATDAWTTQGFTGVPIPIGSD